MANPPEAVVAPIALEPPPRGVRRWIPGVAVLGRYQRAWLLKDLVAGLALTAVLIPAGMGYALAAGLPASCGLYATIVPLLVYAVLGPSRILVLGPDSSLAGIIAATVLLLSQGDSGRAVALAGALAILTGALCLLAGAARLGFVADLLSKPIRFGFLNGIALTVLVGQLPKVLGFSAPGESLVQEVVALVDGLLGGKLNWAALTIGVACLATIVVSKRWLPRVPGMLIAITGATLATAVLDLDTRFGVAVLGALPPGLPSLSLPAVSRADLGTLFAGAAAIALVSFADMSVLSRTFAARGGYRVDPNQELLALGAAHVASGLFQGFSISASTSRTPVAEAAGAKTQVTCLVGALATALLLLLAPGLLARLPFAALGAVVTAACLSLVELSGVLRIYRLRRLEFVLSLVCFLGVALIGVVQGIFLAVGLALAAFIWRAWRPYDAVLGRVDGLKGYHDITRHPEARRVPGLVLFRWDAPLFFANAGIFREHVTRAIAEAPTPTKWVVVAAEPVTDIDTTAADVLLELDAELHAAGMDLCFAEMKGPVKDHLKRYGLFTHFGGAETFFPTLGQAVSRYLELFPVDWKDWEEARGQSK